MKLSGVSFGCDSDLLDGVFQVFLHEGHVVVRAGNSEIKTQKTYNDDNSHYIALYNNINWMRLYMDDVLEKLNEGLRLNSRGRSLTTKEGSTFLGGMSNQTLSNLTGCISNVFIKSVKDSQTVLNLLKVKENVNVPLDCPAAKKPQQIVAAQPKHSNKPRGKHRKPSGSRSRNTRESCQGELSDQEAGATHFSGSTHSYRRYNSLPSSLSSMPQISMVLRINSSDGLVLYAAGGQRSVAVMSLSVSDGHLLLLLDGGKRKVSMRSRKKYNDNQWHTVFIKREGEKISLIVDGISAQSKRIPGGDRTRLAGPLYVGGVPASLTAPGSGGFVGCVRDLTLNEALAKSPTHSQGTVHCFQSPLQPRAYFSGQGGHMAIA
ncbi:laminin subunit alpha-4-like [Cyclopterus lumpus]|uniref:laminin subunit alpha-4-like n=1 Tax=Cyclopterus lumpus TaxID=8103 RepID=UPI001486D3E5|nr:laminin subunit alpha-4-like [Cyclopterus lumpus]